MDIESPRPVLPCFIFTNQTGKIDGYSLSRYICETSGANSLKCVQETKNLWRVYCKSQPARVALVSQGISLQGKNIRVYGQNPYVTGSLNAGLLNQDTEVEMVKVTIKDICSSISNDEVKHLLTNILKLEITSDIQIGYYRDGKGGLTSLENGDRIVWVHPKQLEQPLPRFAYCGNRQCRIFHKNQFSSDGECFNCLQSDHQLKNCPNEKACKVCRKPGHDPGSPQCDHYVPFQKIRTVGGYLDPMSNHFKRRFYYNHVPATTVDNHWFHQKALKNGQEELANLCLNAKDGGKAKSLSKSIRCVDNWDESQMAYDLMKDIVRSKFSQVQESKDALHQAWLDGCIIAEAVPNWRDKWWGTSIDHEGTAHTKPDFWPGKNTLGKILTELSVEFFGENTWPEGEPGTVQALQDHQESREEELNTSMDSYAHVDGPQSDEDNTPAPVETHTQEQSASANVSSNESTGIPVLAHEDKDRIPTPPTAMEPSEEQIKAYLKKNKSFASKLRGRSDSRSRSKSPKTKRSSSPRTPSKKRVQVSPKESEKTKVAIDTVMSNDNSNVKGNSGKARFLYGSNKAS